MNERRPHFQENPAVWRDNGVKLSAPVLGRRMWLITFTDLVSLMLAFFVVLFAMSAVKVDLWDAATDSLSRTLDPSRSPPPVAAHNVPTVSHSPALDLDYLAALFHRVSRDSPELVETRLIRVPNGLILVLSQNAVFAGDDTELSPAAAATLAALRSILGNFSNRIGVRFRGDPAGELLGGYETPWESALIRAAVVANALRKAGYGHDIFAYGLTHADFGKSGEWGSQGKNARIEILIMAESMSRP